MPCEAYQATANHKNSIADAAMRKNTLNPDESYFSSHTPSLSAYSASV